MGAYRSDSTAIAALWIPLSPFKITSLLPCRSGGKHQTQEEMCYVFNAYVLTSNLLTKESFVP